MMGHYNSYEWTNAVDLITKFRCVGVYKPIKNPLFDQLAHRVRGRFGSKIVPTNLIFREIIKDLQRPDELNLYGLISDQSPKLNKANFWIDFMGIKVPAANGGEVIARKFGLSVYYCHVEKIKRGFYNATFVTISENPKEEVPNYITTRFTELLEDQIRANPENYLWSHKRWKHRNEPIPEDANYRRRPKPKQYKI